MTTLVTLDALKEYIKEPTSSNRHDETLEFALQAATDAIRDYTNRHFTRDDTTATPSVTTRVYVADSRYRLYIRDVYDLTGIVVKTDTTDNGTYDTTWTETTDFIVGPFDERDGWPYYRIEAVGSKTFVCSRRPTVEVSALYGWSAVPGKVSETCLELAAELWKRKDAPFGIAGTDDFGTIRIGDSDKRLLGRLNRYQMDPVLVA